MLGFAVAEGKREYCASTRGLANACCLAPFVVFIDILTGIKCAHFMPKLGWIRCFRLLAIENTLVTLLPRWEQVHITILVNFAELFAMNAAFAGSMFYLEGYDDGGNGFTDPASFFYFAIVTLSTVGYGDFSPSSVPGRIVTVCFILLILSVVPQKYNQI